MRNPYAHRRLQIARVDWLTGLYDALIAVITSDLQQHDWQDSRNEQYIRCRHTDN